jgi:hypothetical protein
MMRYVFLITWFVLSITIFFFMGEKAVTKEELYWVVEGEVVIGFYGDLALMAERHDSEVGPKFRLAELKSLDKKMMLLRIGPLKPAPMWKEKSTF